ncbi:MAG: AI-2E family transporter [Planctomycetaceae bacterium]|nr:AI-2E family transporter [Planctomycetaceae bacterium]
MARRATEGMGWRFTAIASACIVIAALYFARTIMIPLALAILLGFLLAPVADRLERWLGRVVAVLVTVILALGLVGALAWGLVSQVVQLTKQLPAYQGEIQAKIAALGGSGSEFQRAARQLEKAVSEGTRQSTSAPTPDVFQPTPQSPLPVRVYPPPGSSLNDAIEVLAASLGSLVYVGMVLVLVFFMLLARADLQDRVLHLISPGRPAVALRALNEGGRRISRYLLSQFIINAGYAAAVMLGLWLIGLTLGRESGGFPNVLLWGLICGVTRFVPYLGPWIGAAFPLLIAFGIFPHYSVFLATAALIATLEITISQFVEPLVYGGMTGLSPLAVLLAAVFWTTVWGPAGLLLSTPLTVVLVVAGKYVPALKFMDVLLGDKPVLLLADRIYQRLVAYDQEEAALLAEGAIEDQSLEDLYDQTLMAVLSMVQRDVQNGRLDKSEHEFILQALNDIVEDLGEANHASRQSLPAQGKGASVLCIPAGDGIDRIACRMLAQLLETRGHVPFSTRGDLTAQQFATIVERRRPEVVVAGSVAPGAVARVRRLVRLLPGGELQAPIIAAAWKLSEPPDRGRRQLASPKTAAVVTTLSQALDEVGRL